MNNIQNAFNTWNEKLAEIWQLVSQSQQSFKGGGIWDVIVSINGALKAIGYALLVIFFAMAVFGGTMSFKEFKNWQTSFRYFIRFVCAKTAVTFGMDIMIAVFSICSGVVNRVASSMGSISAANVTLPGEIQTTIENLGFFESIPLWLVTLLGTLIVTVLSIFLIMSVYGRFFRLYGYTAIAPLPLATFAGEGTSATGKAFLKSYIGVCMEGAIVVICCVIFGVYINSASPGIPSTGPAVSQVWSYLGEAIFNMLVLVGLIKGSDKISKEMLGL